VSAVSETQRSAQSANWTVQVSGRPTETVLEGERKTVTALFADIKGSMELIRDLDPEEARAIVDPVLRLMMKAVHRYGGYVAQSTGDGIFVLFGAPVAHEEHPRRALYAALAMQQELRQYARKLQNDGRPAVEVRIGINTGEVVVRTIHTGGHTEYVPVGHVINLTWRLQMIALAGSVVISDDTRRLVEDYFELRPLGPTAVKGVETPINVYEVVGAGPLRGHFEAAACRGLTRFVGRERELSELGRALELAMSGHGQVVAIVAEAGTGKSRLVYEFKARLPAECKLLEAYSVSHGKASAWLPVLELLHTYFGVAGVDDPLTRRGKVSSKVSALDPTLSDTLQYLFGLLGIQEDPDSLAQMDAQVRKRRTLSRPVIAG
jgi:class 3 adenylate cyclase